VVSETSYAYKPVLGLMFTSALNLDHTSYFLPRFAKCVKVVVGAGTSACS
jgi:hypothetical protein